MASIEQLLKDNSAGIVRAQIRKIVEIYDLEWIMVHELLQNAIDAIQTNPEVDEGDVRLTIDLNTDKVTVEDNGTGFMFDLNLLCPGGSGDEKQLSSRSPSKGYQGVGLKAVMYSTLAFTIESQTSDSFWTFHVDNLAEYIAPDSTADPEYESSNLYQTDEPTYTKVIARFPPGQAVAFLDSIGRFLDEDSVKWQQLYSDEIDDDGDKPYHRYAEHFISWYFRTQSYVGCVNRLTDTPVQNATSKQYGEIKPINIHVKLTSSDGFSSVNGPLGIWLQSMDSNQLTFTVPNRYWDYAEVIEANLVKAIRFRVAPDMINIRPTDSNWEMLSAGSNFQSKFLDLKLRPNENATEFEEKYADFIWMIDRPRSSVNARDYEDVFNKITGIYLAIGRTAQFETLGIRNNGLKVIASNGTVTDHDLVIRSTSSTWYQETIHIVVNLDATLNLGKRHLVNTRLVGRIKEFFNDAYPKLVSIAKLFVERDSGATGLGSEIEMPNVLGIEAIRRQDIPFRRFPTDENTLIGLFSSAISQLDPEYTIYGFFSKAIYDGKFSWNIDELTSESDLRRIEFKLRLEVLVEEFQRSTADKEFSDLDLLVVWNRKLDVPGWAMKGVSTARRNSLEGMGVPTHLIEYIVEDRSGRYCPVISVPELLIRIPLIEGASDDLASYIEAMG